jgi:hypothetical protein
MEVGRQPQLAILPPPAWRKAESIIIGIGLGWMKISAKGVGRQAKIFPVLTRFVPGRRERLPSSTIHYPLSIFFCPSVFEKKPIGDKPGP